MALFTVHRDQKFVAYRGYGFSPMSLEYIINFSNTDITVITNETTYKNLEKNTLLDFSIFPLLKFSHNNPYVLKLKRTKVC
jgi:hypothetical protein